MCEGEEGPETKPLCPCLFQPRPSPASFLCCFKFLEARGPWPLGPTRLHALGKFPFSFRKTVDLCRQVEAAGVSWIAVHGRKPDAIVLREHPVNYAAIKLIKDAVKVPVVANGDAWNMTDVQRIVHDTGVDGVMAARGLLRNPTMFAGTERASFAVMHEWVKRVK